MTMFQPMVISGPSGSGKSTLLEKLMKEYKDCFAFSVSHTTRGPRQGESDKIHYHFVTREKFEEMIASNGFLEHAQFSGNRYGTSFQAVRDIQETGRIPILDVEINGVKNIKKTDLNARYLFVRPPSLNVLKKRLLARGTETPESLQKRLDTVQEALDYADQKGTYDHIILNDDLEVAYEKLKGILLEDIHKLQTEKLKR